MSARTLAVSLALLAGTSAAQPTPFEPLGGPYSRGDVAGVLDDGTLFGIGRSGELRTSADRGRSWTEVDGAPPRVTRLEVLPDQSLLMTTSYVTGPSPTPGGLFRSADRGATWTRVGPEALDRSVPLAVSASGAHWALADAADVHLSSDGGATWTTVAPGQSSSPILSLAFDADDRLLAARYSDAAVSSTVERWDGTAWERAATPIEPEDNVKTLKRLADGRVAAISYAYQSPVFSWFTRDPALYLSGNGGDSWARLDDGRVTDVALRPGGDLLLARPSGIEGDVPALHVPAPGRLLVGADGTVYASSPRAGAYALAPGAGAWTQVGTYAGSLPIAEADGQLVAGGDGVLLARDGADWVPVRAPDDGVAALDATGSGLFISTGEGLYAVDALGEAPRLLDVCDDGAFCAARGVAETVTGALVAAAGCGLYRSADGGDTWELVLDGVDLRAPAAGPGLLLAGEYAKTDGCAAAEDRGVVVSTDDGRTWTTGAVGIADARGVAALVTPSGEAFVGAYSGLYRRAADGAWTHLSSTRAVDLAWWDGALVAAAFDGVVRYADGALAPAGLDGLATLGLLVRADGSLVATTEDGVFEASPAPTSVHGPVAGEGLRITVEGASPSRGAVRLGVEADGPVAVEAFDLLGRHVASLHDGPPPPAPLQWTAPSPGVYLVRARSGDRQATVRVTVVR